MSPLPGIAVFADFDDTLTTRNVAHFLLEKCAPEALAHHSNEYRSGRSTFREYQERSFDAVEATVAEMQDVLRGQILLREGARELVSAVDRAGGTFTVVSAGLRLYIEPVLAEHGLDDVGVVCGDATKPGTQMNGEGARPGASAFKYDYPFPNLDSRGCKGDWATCKCRALEQAPEEAVTVFVGDGSTSDACAAPRADYVFARDRLLDICRQRGVDAEPFDDLHAVADFVAELATGENRTKKLGRQ